MKVLITGIAGSMGRLVAQGLLARGHQVVGLDVRVWPQAPPEVTSYQLDLRKRPAEEVFRRHRPQAVIHMATVAHVRPSTEDHRINLHGTRAVWDYSRQYGARAALFVGRHTYYGASADSPLYHDEDDPPLAVTTFPELSDLVAADLYAGSALWRSPELRTVVLRICYTLGPSRVGTLFGYLRGPRVPMVLGFDPLFQFMHERDAAAAICIALESEIRGVFNVAGPPPLPLSLLVSRAGRTAIPLPEPLFNLALGRFGLPRMAAGARMHVKYPVVVDDGAFRKETGFAHLYDEEQAIGGFRAAVAAGG